MGAVISSMPRVDDSELAAAYGLALRITGDRDRATDSVVSAFMRTRESNPALIRAVRAEARSRRPEVEASPPVERPARFAAVAADDWDVLERVALRGMDATEASRSLGLDRSETLLRLRRGLVAVRDLRERQARDHADAPALDRLGRDHPAGVRDDAPGDRQPEAAPAPLIAG